MPYQKITLDGFVDEFEAASNGYHAKKFCFILGAGASKSSGIITGQELVDIWDSELQKRNKDDYEEWISENGITEKNKYSFYSKYYEKRYSREPIDGYDFLERQMDGCEPSIGYNILAHLMVSTPNNVVITTNFDSLTEDSLNYYQSTKALVVGHEALAYYALQRTNRPKVIKIHRDLLLNPANTSDELEELNANWQAPLYNIFSDYNPVFIGYAGNDNSLMNFLIANAKKFKCGGNWQCPYWFIFKDEKIEGKVKTFLEKADGYYIRHNGFDDVMLSIGNVGINPYRFPTEEAFLQPTKSRYEKLQNTYAGFSKSKDISPEAKDALNDITDSSEELQILLKANILFDSKDYEKALDLYKKIVDVNPNNAYNHYNLAYTYGCLGKYYDAIQEIKAAINLEPLSSAYHAYLGFLYYETSNYESAKEELEKAIEYNPNNSDAYNSLAYVMLKNKQLKSACQMIEKAISINPKEPEYYDSMGEILREMESFPEAIKNHKTSLEMDPKNAGHHYNYALTLLADKQIDKASRELEKAIELDPQNKDYKQKYTELNASVADE